MKEQHIVDILNLLTHIKETLQTADTGLSEKTINELIKRCDAAQEKLDNQLYL